MQGADTQLLGSSHMLHGVVDEKCLQWIKTIVVENVFEGKPIGFALANSMREVNLAKIGPKVCN